MAFQAGAFQSPGFQIPAAKPSVRQPPQPKALRSRTTKRIPKRLIRREIETPDGPLIVLVPDDWSADDMMTLTTALVLSDALH